MQGKDVKTRLGELYTDEMLIRNNPLFISFLSELSRIKKEKEKIINECEHDRAEIVSYGSDFDGYDRNEPFTLVECPDCLKKQEYGRVNATDKFGQRRVVNIPKKEGIKFLYR